MSETSRQNKYSANVLPPLNNKIHLIYYLRCCTNNHAVIASTIIFGTLDFC